MLPNSQRLSRRHQNSRRRIRLRKIPLTLKYSILFSINIMPPKRLKRKRKPRPTQKLLKRHLKKKRSRIKSHRRFQNRTSKSSKPMRQPSFKLIKLLLRAPMQPNPLLKLERMLLPLQLKLIKPFKKSSKRMSQKISGRRICRPRELSKTSRPWSTKQAVKLLKFKSQYRLILRCLQRLRSQFQKSFQLWSKLRRKQTPPVRLIRQSRHK